MSGVELMHIRWFGPKWNAPVCDVTYRSEAPLGEICLACNDPVADGERGILTACSPEIDGSFDWWIDGEARHVAAYHIDCQLRALLGPDARVIARRA